MSRNLQSGPSRRLGPHSGLQEASGKRGKDSIKSIGRGRVDSQIVDRMK